MTSGFLSLFYHSANLPNITVKEFLCQRKYHMNITQLSPPDKRDIEREILCLPPEYLQIDICSSASLSLMSEGVFGSQSFYLTAGNM